MMGLVEVERWIVVVCLQSATFLLLWSNRRRWRQMKTGEWLTRAGYIALCQSTAFSSLTFLISPEDLAAWRLPLLSGSALLVLTGSAFRVWEARCEAKEAAWLAGQAVWPEDDDPEPDPG